MPIGPWCWSCIPFTCGQPVCLSIRVARTSSTIQSQSTRSIIEHVDSSLISRSGLSLILVLTAGLLTQTGWLHEGDDTNSIKTNDYWTCCFTFIQMYFTVGVVSHSRADSLSICLDGLPAWVRRYNPNRHKRTLNLLIHVFILIYITVGVVSRARVDSRTARSDRLAIRVRRYKPNKHKLYSNHVVSFSFWSI